MFRASSGWPTSGIHPAVKSPTVTPTPPRISPQTSPICSPSLTIRTTTTPSNHSSTRSSATNSPRTSSSKYSPRSRGGGGGNALVDTAVQTITDSAIQTDSTERSESPSSSSRVGGVQEEGEVNITPPLTPSALRHEVSYECEAQ